MAELQDQARTQIIEDILSERTRQIEVEGFNEAHDDQHGFSELARAAAVYATYAALPEFDREQGKKFGPHHYGALMLWPWEAAYFKLSDPRRDMIKAAALLVAEIERLDRLEGRP